MSCASTRTEPSFSTYSRIERNSSPSCRYSSVVRASVICRSPLAFHSRSPQDLRAAASISTGLSSRRPWGSAAGALVAAHALAVITPNLGAIDLVLDLGVFGRGGDPVDRRAAYPEALCDLRRAQTFLAQLGDGLRLDGRFPALVDAGFLRRGDALQLTLAPDGRLELGKDAEHLQERPPGRRRNLIVVLLGLESRC